MDQKNKKTIDGYYYDKTGGYTLYKDEAGYITKKKHWSRKKIDRINK